MRSLLLFFFLLPVVFFAQTWFPDVQTPLDCSEEQMVQFTSYLRGALKKGTPPKEILKRVPSSSSAPRALFLTLCDGEFPSRTYYAVGDGFGPTLEMLLSILEKRRPEYEAAIRADLEAQVSLAQQEKRQLPANVKQKLAHPGQWDALRLDVVQSTVAIPKFQVNSTRLLFSSLVGIAFDPTSAFAFTPEQLTGRYLMTPQRQLSVARVGNLISEANLWSSLGLWQKMGATDIPFKATLFESDSYYADAQGCRRLFRAHAARVLPQPDLDETLQAALKTATLLKDDGTLNAPFPEWISGLSGGAVALSDQAGLAYAFLELRDAVADKNAKATLLEAARKATLPLLKAVKHLDPGEKLENGMIVSENRRKSSQRLYAMLVEDDPQEDSPEFQIPPRVSTLRANALGYLVFQRLSEALPAQDPTGRKCASELQQLYRHLSQQVTPAGSVIPAVEYPTRKPIVDDLENAAENIPLEEAALAALALQKHLPLLSEQEAGNLQKNLDVLRNSLGEDAVRHLDAAASAPWLIRFLSQDATKENPERLAQLTRISLAATEDAELAPPIPDMFGCDPDLPSMTYAAERTMVASLAALALQKAGAPQEALPLLQEAWPIWVFQAQATITPETASILPQPYKYLQFFRDNLADFGFTPDGQSTQILSRLALHQALNALQLNAFQPTPDQEKAWQANWQKIDQHPVAVAPELALPGTVPPENQRSQGGSLGKPTVETKQIKDANLTYTPGKTVSDHVETRVIDRSKKSKKR